MTLSHWWLPVMYLQTKHVYQLVLLLETFCLKDFFWTLKRLENIPNFQCGCCDITLTTNPFINHYPVSNLLVSFCFWTYCFCTLCLNPNKEISCYSASGHPVARLFIILLSKASITLYRVVLRTPTQFTSQILGSSKSIHSSLSCS